MTDPPHPGDGTATRADGPAAGGQPTAGPNPDDRPERPPAQLPAGDDPRILDPTALRALAHPLRIRLLFRLQNDGPATATQLADALGERSGTTSWHLRHLARHGFVVEVPDRGTARERWWRAVHRNLQIPPREEFLDDPVTRAALGVFADEALRHVFTRAAAAVASAHTLPADWRESLAFSNWEDLSVSAAEAAALVAAIDEAIERYRRPARPGDRRFVVQLQAFPDPDRAGLGSGSARGGPTHPDTGTPTDGGGIPRGGPAPPPATASPAPPPATAP